jgi:hypothetical protein
MAEAVEIPLATYRDLSPARNYFLPSGFQFISSVIGGASPRAL